MHYLSSGFGQNCRRNEHREVLLIYCARCKSSWNARAHWRASFQVMWVITSFCPFVPCAPQVSPRLTSAPSRYPAPQQASVVPHGHSNRRHHASSRSHAPHSLLHQWPSVAPLLRAWMTPPYSSRCSYPIHTSSRSWRSGTRRWLRPYSAETWVNQNKNGQVFFFYFQLSFYIELNLTCQRFVFCFFNRAFHQSAAGATAGSSQEGAGEDQTHDGGSFWFGSTSKDRGGDQVRLLLHIK